MKLEILVAIAGFLIGLGTTLSSVIIWYSNSVKKRYAAERDFQHLKNNYQQLAQNQGVILDELDEIKDSVIRELVEIKSFLYRNYFEKRKDS